MAYLLSALAPLRETYADARQDAREQRGKDFFLMAYLLSAFAPLRETYADAHQDAREQRGKDFFLHGLFT